MYIYIYTYVYTYIYIYVTTTIIYIVRPVRLLRVWTSEGLTQTLISKGWEFSCPLNFIGGLPESLTQGPLVGKLLIGGLGVLDVALRLEWVSLAWKRLVPSKSGRRLY